MGRDGDRLGMVPHMELGVGAALYPPGSLLEAIIKSHVKTVLKHYSFISSVQRGKEEGQFGLQAAGAHR